MFKRKIYGKLKEWKANSNGTTALMIEGARRVGKSTVAEEFARRNYKDYLLIDFSIASQDFLRIFDDLSNIDDFFRDFFLALRRNPLKPGALIIFDEVQFCPKARQAIKHLVRDGRYQYLETGSLVSIKEKVSGILIPSEEERISMYPMDYEEFLWALNMDFEAETLKSIYQKRDTVFSNKNHSSFIKNWRLYLAVGGMPQAVAKYIETKDFYSVDRIKKNIIALYEEDLRKFDNEYGTICYPIWKQIPGMLSKHSTRFIASSVDERADSALFQNTLSKLEESHMVNVVYRCTEPKAGLRLTKDETYFKIYFNDVGLFTSLVYAEEPEESNDIYQRLILDNVNGNLGMLYENYVCQALVANGHRPYYYSWNEKTDGKNYEVDFLFEKKGKSSPIEVKSSQIKSLSSLNLFSSKYSDSTGECYLILPKPLRYGENLTYLPTYLTFNL